MPAKRAQSAPESSDLLAQLPPGQEHGPDSQRDIGTVEQQSFNLPIEGQSPHRAGQKAERLSTPRMWLDNRLVIPIS